MLEVVVVLLLLAPAPVSEPARWLVSGVVRDEAGRPVVGARVERAGGPETAETDAAGRFSLELPEGPLTLRAARPGEPAVTVRLDLRAPVPNLEVTLPTPPRIAANVVVEAVRAADWAPLTTADLPKEELQRLDRGQELPFLLKETPAVSQYSDNGSEGGYAYLYLRGIPQTRLNFTLDGVPLNDAEDNAFYPVDLAGLVGALDSLQIQRGVGTSSFGSASFGGSINLESLHPAGEPELQAGVGLGSLGTGRATLGAHSGRFGPGLGAFARATYQETDGYRDHSGVLQRGLALGLSRQGSRSFLKLFGLAGREQQQLAFLAVDEDTLRASPRENPLSPAERDRFSQQVLHAQFSYAPADATRLTAQAYTNAASGWYRIYADPERTTLYEYGLDWRAVGGIATLNHRRGRLDLTAGGHVQGFGSTHERAVVDVGPDYSNQGDKDEWSAFAKARFSAGRVDAWADAQVRRARFRFEGELDLGSVAWTFFNPRIGLRFALSPPFSLYASLGRSSREPARSDLFAGEDNPTLPYDLRAVQPEEVTDVEAGADWRGERLSLQANVYFMEFRNEIAQTGELSEIGLPLRRNVDRSFRRGLEIEAAFRPSGGLRFLAGASLNRSRIRTWTQFLDVYDESGAYVTSEARTFTDVPPLLTPPFLGTATAEASKGSLTASLTGRYVSRAHLDNTGRDASRTPGYFEADLKARYRLTRRFGEVRLRLEVLNLFDNSGRWPSGYSYLFLTRDTSGRVTSGREAPGGVNYFYPLAGRTVFVGLELGL
jgi:iron complex outermembrane receptor protein